MASSKNKEPRVLEKKKIKKTLNNVAIKKPAIVKKEKKRQIKEEIPETAVEKNENINDITQLKLDEKQISDGINAVFTLAKKRCEEKATFLNTENEPIFMQVNCIQIPKVSTRQLRILLPHTLVTDTDDVALFVKDLKRGRNRDYEPTINYYKDILDKHGCTKVKTVIPIVQVKTEYRQFELRRKLFNTYDYFLTDGRIAGHLSKLLGRQFSSKGKLPTSIRSTSKNIKQEIDIALQKTCMQLHSLGNTHTVKVAHTGMTEKQVFENILAVCKGLAKSYPGGWNNIRSLHIKTALTLAVPIYVTIKSSCEVEIPIVPSKRPKAYKPVTGELTTFVGKVTVTVEPDGNLTVKRKRNSYGKTPVKSENTEENNVTKKKKIKK